MVHRAVTRAARRRDDRGVVSVVVAVSALALILVAALVVNGGAARYTRRVSQNAADAAALAAVNKLYPSSSVIRCSDGVTVPPCITDAVTAAKAYASANLAIPAADWADNSLCPADPNPTAYVPPGSSRCISFDNAVAPRKVRVRIPYRSVPAGLGGLAGVSSITVSAKAEGVVTGGTQCTLCILGDVYTNNSDFNVGGGSMAVAGDITANGANFNAASIQLTGTTNGGNYTPATTHITSVPDPYADMTLPLNTSALPTRTDPCSAVAGVGGPGVYNVNVNLPATTCTLQPGLYVITGTWATRNNTFLTNQPGGVTLYVKSTGKIDFKNGSISLSAYTSGPSAGFVLLADRDATNSIELQGNGITGLSGAVYAKSAPLVFNGNSNFNFNGGPIVIGGSSSVGNQSGVAVLNPQDAVLSFGPPALDQ